MTITESQDQNNIPPNSSQAKPPQIPFIQIPRSLLEHPTVRACPDAYFRVLITIFENVCYLPSQVDDHGKLINLQPGQFCCTERRLAELSKASKSDVHRAIKRFLEVKILNQEVIHTKNIITITHSDSCELIKRYNEPRFEPRMNQDRTKSEPQKDKERKRERDNKKEKEKKEKIPKIKIRECVELTQIEHDKLIEQYGAQQANAMFDILNSYKLGNDVKYPSDYGKLLKGGWVEKTYNERKVSPNPKPLNGFNVDRRTKTITGVPMESIHDGRF